MAKTFVYTGKVSQSQYQFTVVNYEVIKNNLDNIISGFKFILFGLAEGNVNLNNEFNLKGLHVLGVCTLQDDLFYHIKDESALSTYIIFETSDLILHPKGWINNDLVTEFKPDELWFITDRETKIVYKLSGN